MLAGFRADNISLVDPARVPALPARPRVLLYMAAALAGGLFLGAGAALVTDGMDAQIHDFEALESELGQGLLGMLPYHKAARSRFANASRPRNRSQSSDGKSRMPALNETDSAFVESLRALRTSLLLSKVRTPPQVILITSSVPGEGKSMLSANFATILADRQKKVLLVDADLRHPNLHYTLNTSSETGLSWLLALWSLDKHRQTFESAARSVIIPVAGVPQLHFVPAGTVPEHPAELLSSDFMCQAIKIWRVDFDYIVIDGSPVLPVTDAVILSGMADFTLLTARYKVVEQQALLRAFGILRSQAGNNNIGIVLNAVQKSAGAYYSSYGYASSRLDANRIRS